jgi:hypothetical protein
LKIEFERGYLIPAVNTKDTDYVACARLLAKSIKQWHPDAKVCLLTDKEYSDPVFDYVRLLPHGDQDANSSWKLSNDWQSYIASPFRQTIKLEADMIATSPIDHWWTLFVNRDVVISQGCRNIYDQVSKSRQYRKQFDINNLPDVYNAVTYWRLSKPANEFFMLVKRIFTEWSQFRTLLKFSDDYPTTDVVYALAAIIIGSDQVTLPPGLGPQIVHMKRFIAPINGNDWTKELVWEHTDPGLRIHTVAQWGFVHYHIKEWANE